MTDANAAAEGALPRWYRSRAAWVCSWGVFGREVSSLRAADTAKMEPNFASMAARGSLCWSKAAGIREAGAGDFVRAAATAASRSPTDIRAD